MSQPFHVTVHDLVMVEALCVHVCCVAKDPPTRMFHES